MKTRLFGAILLSAFLGLAGCGGSDGKDGEDADPAELQALQDQIDALGATTTTDPATAVRPEACVLCHDNDGSLAKSGAQHQLDYEEFYQDQALRVINLAYSNAGGMDIVTFDMTKKDDFGVEQPFDCTLATSNPEPDVTDALSINFVQYDPGTRTFSDGAASTFWRNIKGTLEYDGNGGCTSTKAQSVLGDLSLLNGHIAVYGRDETLPSNSSGKLDNPKFPFATMVKTGAPGTDYESVANASGCENCHTRPFLKHAYIYGEVNDGTNNDGNDFYVCKTCHLDARNGGHQDWQLLKDDPARHADLHELAEAAAAQVPPDTAHDSVTENMTADEKAKYAYKTRLMNDVHMSHNMEFGFPQSMKTCATCHADKITETLATENYTVETCISCHAVDGLVAKMKTNRAGNAVTVHDAFADPDKNGVITAAEADQLKAITCNACHSPAGYMGYISAGTGPEFTSIHNGYDPEIYANAAGTKYSEAFVVSVDSASFNSATNILTIGFSAEEVIDVAGLAVADIVPTLMVGPYGYGTKHYIVAPHDRDADRNRLLEYVIGSGPHPRISETVDSTPGDWEVTVDMSMWADMIADGKIRRVEIGVMPELDDLNGDEVAMNAPSRTFDLTAPPSGVFLNEYPDVADGVEDDVVNVLGGCNTCHDALATSFHSGKRGGNIKICKMCHVPSAAGSHLEMQSRSIDSYVHAIHSFQVFDIGDIDFSDPVEAAEHDHKLQSEFPRFGIKNCESCHNPDTYGVPDQSKSLPSLHSGNDDVEGRNIGEVPPYVMGPAARACGACHRAQMLRADDADKLTAFNRHVETFGYLVENDDGVWDKVVETIMSMF
jgi:OmcA/MtrC family decaheme c-type cytochrome